jgi:hypothetical protein
MAEVASCFFSRREKAPIEATLHVVQRVRTAAASVLHPSGKQQEATRSGRPFHWSARGNASQKRSFTPPNLKEALSVIHAAKQTLLRSKHSASCADKTSKRWENPNPPLAKS